MSLFGVLIKKKYKSFIAVLGRRAKTHIEKLGKLGGRFRNAKIFWYQNIIHRPAAIASPGILVRNTESWAPSQNY